MFYRFCVWFMRIFLVLDLVLIIIEWYQHGFALSYAPTTTKSFWIWAFMASSLTLSGQLRLPDKPKKSASQPDASSESGPHDGPTVPIAYLAPVNAWRWVCPQCGYHKDIYGAGACMQLFGVSVTPRTLPSQYLYSYADSTKKCPNCFAPITLAPVLESAYAAPTEPGSNAHGPIIIVNPDRFIQSKDGDSQ